MNDALVKQFNLGGRSSGGLLITFDGIDGSGKTTSIRNLSKVLRKCGHQVRIYKLPSRECKALKIYQQSKADPLNSENRVDLLAIFLIVMGDRLNTIKSEIEPLLAKGYVVIVDRYLFSVICEILISPSASLQKHQAVLCMVIEQFPRPDIAFFNRVSFAEATKRIHSRSDEKDLYINPGLFNSRAEGFERLRLQFNGTLLDTTLNQSNCLKAMKEGIKKNYVEHQKKSSGKKSLYSKSFEINTLNFQ